jgi:hypothetical protein
MQLSNHIKKELRAVCTASLTDPNQLREVNDLLNGNMDKQPNLGPRGSQEE